MDFTISCTMESQKFTPGIQRLIEKPCRLPIVIPSFDESVRYYVVKDGNFHVVKTKGSVLQVLSDRKSELKNFLRKNRIRYNDDREKAIVRLTEFYDTLND